MRNNNSKQPVLWIILIIGLGLLLAPLRAAGQSLADAIAAVDECVQKAETKLLIKPVVEITKLDRAFVEKALTEGNYKVSDLVIVQVIAAKSGQSPAAVLASRTGSEWSESLKKAGISQDDMREKLDDAYADFALKMMDVPGKKKDPKRTAKR